jgi:hypothetical protein
MKSDSSRFSGDIEANVIAGAIAAFQYNNSDRTIDSIVNHAIIPCISILDTQPTFYKVPVTTELSDAVKMGQFPASPTIVESCVVFDNSENITLYDSMELPKYRQLALRHFVAFRALAKSCWADYALKREELNGKDID